MELNCVRWRTLTLAALASAALAPPAAYAQAEPLPATPAAGIEVFASTDSEGSDTLRIAIDFDLRNQGQDRRTGVRVEKARYDPLDTGTRDRTRAFVRASDVTGSGWYWSALVGTDGHTVIGSASLHDRAPFRKEFFIERDVVETPRGLDEGIYSTFTGAAIDLPASRKTTFTLLGGVQDFTGNNTRLHARANIVQVVDDHRGISAQLRGRYFRDSTPHEYDYYSPRWFAQVLPVVQMRRFTGGWELVGLVGVGIQRDDASGWQRADLAQVRVRSPQRGNWYLSGNLTYSNTPGNTAEVGNGYRYFGAQAALTRRF